MLFTKKREIFNLLLVAPTVSKVQLVFDIKYLPNMAVLQLLKLFLEDGNAIIKVCRILFLITLGWWCSRISHKWHIQDNHVKWGYDLAHITYQAGYAFFVWVQCQSHFQLVAKCELERVQEFFEFRNCGDHGHVHFFAICTALRRNGSLDQRCLKYNSGDGPIKSNVVY